MYPISFRRLLILGGAILHFNFVLGQVKLTNPIFAGFYPDPSIVKNGEDYYLVNSTFSYFPGLPVFHSRDLTNWEQVGFAIDRTAQMDFLGQQLSQGLYAPAINFHKGVYYISCTNIGKGGNFIITSRDPAKGWSDPVYVKEARGIDPSLLFDGDRLYIVYNSDPPDNQSQYNGHRTIRIRELDPTSFNVLDTERILINGGVDISKKPVWIEGPHIYNRNGWYYLMAAEGGTGSQHSEVVFRSRSVYGPYSPYDRNPILTQRNSDPSRQDPIGSVGHADLVEGPDGTTWVVFLGVRPYEGDYYNTGRETFIAPVTWTDDGWPVINPGSRNVQYHYTGNWSPRPLDVSKRFTGNFRDTVLFDKPLGYDFQFLRNRDTSIFTIDAVKKSLLMRLSPETVSGKGNPSFIGRRQQHLTCTVSTEMSFEAKQENEKAGMVIFQNEKHFYYLCRSSARGKPVIQLYKANDSGMVLQEQVVLKNNSPKLILKIEADRSQYRFSYSYDRRKWNILKDQVDAKFLSTQVAGGFVGSFFALYATSCGEKKTESKVLYKWMEYDGNDRTMQ